MEGAGIGTSLNNAGGDRVLPVLAGALFAARLKAFLQLKNQVKTARGHVARGEQAGGSHGAPFTMGLSLIFTLLGAGLTIWEAREYLQSRSDLNKLTEKATGIRQAAAVAADEPEEIHREVEARP